MEARRRRPQEQRPKLAEEPLPKEAVTKRKQEEVSCPAGVAVAAAFDVACCTRRCLRWGSSL